MLSQRLHSGKRRGSNRVWPVALLLLWPLGWYVSQPRAEPLASPLTGRWLALTGPIGQAVLRVRVSVVGAWRHYIALTGVARDNDRLAAKVAGLEEQLLAWHEVGQENLRLRTLLALPLAEPWARRVAAQVTAYSPLATCQSIRINRGSQHGIVRGDAVVAAQGLLGRVVLTSGQYALVVLLTDASSAVDALVQRSRARVRLRGRGTSGAVTLDAQSLARTADVVPGDLLLTSGLGGTYPKGLLVGRVRSIEQRAYGLYQRATAEPAVDFSRLEDVMVVSTAAPPLEPSGGP